MDKKRKKPKKEKLDLQVKKVACFLKVNLSPEEEGHCIYFIPSGFKGTWLKIWECYDYAVGVDYASSQENEILNKVK